MSKFDFLTLDQIKQSVEKILTGKYHFCFLLGSAATPRFNDESDLDLAVYFKEAQSFKELSHYSLKFSEEFDRECDLVQLNSIDPIFARQVLETGRELSMANRSFFNIWKSGQLSQYPDFKASRKIIEDHLLNRKKYV
jgi:predicted nucleotidyltransferase